MTDDRPFWDKQVETISRDELAALQLARLRIQVDRLYHGSVFYREKLTATGFEPGALESLDDLTRLPLVTKQELREEQVSHPPFGRYTLVPPRQWAELHPSTGTTGVPVATIWSVRDVNVITDVTARTMWGVGVRSGDIVQNAFAYGLWVAGMSVHYATRHLGCFVIPIGAIATEQQIHYLRMAGPTVLFSTPSYALHIAERLKERGVAPSELSLRVGCFGGEAGTENPATRAKIEDGLGIKAYDYFGLGEIGPTMACECTAKVGLHWSEDLHIVEIIDAVTRRPVREGETGIVVLTHLDRDATPMLRYWTNDYAKLDTSPCVCGRTHARSPGGILGRADDLVIFRGAKFYPVQVEQVVRSLDGLGDEFRIERRHVGDGVVETCVVVAELAPGAEAQQAGVRDQLQDSLRSALGVTPEVRVEPFGAIERTTFKAKRLIDL